MAINKGERELIKKNSKESTKKKAGTKTPE